MSERIGQENLAQVQAITVSDAAPFVQHLQELAAHVRGERPTADALQKALETAYSRHNAQATQQMVQEGIADFRQALLERLALVCDALSETQQRFEALAVQVFAPGDTRPNQYRYIEALKVTEPLAWDVKAVVNSLEEMVFSDGQGRPNTLAALVEAMDAVNADYAYHPQVVHQLEREERLFEYYQRGIVINTPFLKLLADWEDVYHQQVMQWVGAWELTQPLQELQAAHMALEKALQANDGDPHYTHWDELSGVIRDGADAVQDAELLTLLEVMDELRQELPKLAELQGLHHLHRRSVLAQPEESDFVQVGYLQQSVSVLATDVESLLKGFNKLAEALQDEEVLGRLGVAGDAAFVTDYQGYIHAWQMLTCHVLSVLEGIETSREFVKLKEKASHKMMQQERYEAPQRAPKQVLEMGSYDDDPQAAHNHLSEVELKALAAKEEAAWLQEQQAKRG